MLTVNISITVYLLASLLYDYWDRRVTDYRLLVIAIIHGLIITQLWILYAQARIS